MVSATKLNSAGDHYPSPTLRSEEMKKRMLQLMRDEDRGEDALLLVNGREEAKAGVCHVLGTSRPHFSCVLLSFL